MAQEALFLMQVLPTEAVEAGVALTMGQAGQEVRLAGRELFLSLTQLLLQT
jgi:hypothetical protein